jgi:hypothetical protein
VFPSECQLLCCYAGNLCLFLDSISDVFWDSTNDVFFVYV